MTPPIMVPAPTFRDGVGELDLGITHRYAERLAMTWAPVVLVSGPMGQGEDMSSSERAGVLDVWRRHLSGGRLVAACWSDADIAHAQDSDVRALVMLQAATTTELVKQIEAAPMGAWVYSNPRYSHAMLTPELIVSSRVSGVKLSKVTTRELAEFRTAAPSVTIVHGSSRSISSSITAGADLVTAPPLATLPQPWPAKSLNAVQDVVDRIQWDVDQAGDHAARVRRITDIAVRNSAPS